MVKYDQILWLFAPCFFSIHIHLCYLVQKKPFCHFHQNQNRLLWLYACHLIWKYLCGVSGVCSWLGYGWASLAVTVSGWVRRQHLGLVTLINSGSVQQPETCLFAGEHIYRFAVLPKDVLIFSPYWHGALQVQIETPWIQTWIDHSSNNLIIKLLNWPNLYTWKADPSFTLLNKVSLK